MAKNKVITPDIVNWVAYRDNIERAIANETIWGLGGSEFADENIENLKEELELIINEEYAEVFSKYDIEVWENYLK